LLQRLHDAQEYAFRILQNIVVPEADDAPAFTDQEGITPVVVAR
jgi:hypothetical protein